MVSVRRFSAHAVLAGLLLVAPVMAACSDEGAGEATPDSAAGAGSTVPLFAGDDFYTPPDPLPPGEPGRLIRLQAVPADGPGAVYRMMYHSRSLAGDDIAVTGLVVVPPEPAPAGGRPVVSWAHGTTGIADRCAPSRAAGNLAALAAPLVEEGWLVVATDYEGLGTPGRHPYLVGISAGRSVLDAARAVQDDGRFAASDRVAIWGHSQGGHAALFAAELAERWTPELDVVGAVAVAPATELPLLLAALRGGPYQAYVAMGAAGFAAAYPDAQLEQILTPEAIDRLQVVDRVCVSEVFAAFDDLSFDRLVHSDPARVEPWGALLHENNPGTVAHDVPLLIVHGSDDRQVPAPASRLLAERLCGLGQVLDRRVYQGAGHGEVVAVSRPEVVGWIGDRFEQAPPPSSCPT